MLSVNKKRKRQKPKDFICRINLGMRMDSRAQTRRFCTVKKNDTSAAALSFVLLGSVKYYLFKLKIVLGQAFTHLHCFYVLWNVSI